MAKAEDVAEKVLADAGIMAPPIPVEEVATGLGARVFFEHFEPELSGILYRDAERRVVIGVNAGHMKTRQRFTIAHEIGHLCLHEGQPMFVDHSVRIDRRDENASKGADPLEIAANSFAAALLMPEDMLLAAMKRSATRPASRRAAAMIQQLARRFDVSAQAMEYRLANLGLVDPPH